jgi:cysteine desulfurase
MLERLYLDWNATAPLRPQARAAMAAALDAVGNPSSVHAEGRAARELVEAAREAVARLVGGEARNAVFTSGGTEANALALTPGIGRPGRPGCGRLLVSAIEHPSVLCGGRFAAEAMERVPVTGDGTVDLGALATRLRAITDHAAPLVSIMLANNETGVQQPIQAAAELVHAAGGLLHVDAVQAAGRMSFEINGFGADLVTVSAHKLGGPQGVGALIRADAAIQVPALIRGGGQERGSRAGTENVAAIAGFGAAADAAARELGQATVPSGQPAQASEPADSAGLQARLEAGLRQISPDVTVFGERSPRLPNTSLFAVPAVKAETALIALDLDGVAVSSGSACSSGKVTPSHVLAAMGVGEELASGAIRVSWGWTTTEADIDRFLGTWRMLVSRLNKTSKNGQRGLAA